MVKLFFELQKTWIDTCPQASLVSTFLAASSVFDSDDTVSIVLADKTRMFCGLLGPPEKCPTAETGYTTVVLCVWLTLLGGL
jgi:hypothetical protein